MMMDRLKGLATVAPIFLVVMGALGALIYFKEAPAQEQASARPTVIQTQGQSGGGAGGTNFVSAPTD